jgi:hypothetical protein
MAKPWQIHDCAGTWIMGNMVVETFWIMYGFLAHIL